MRFVAFVLTLLAGPLCPAAPLDSHPLLRPDANISPQFADASLSVVRLEDMAFGSIIPNGGGTVLLRPQGNHRSTTGTLVLMSTPPAQCARFQVTGQKNAMYAVLVPPSVVLTRRGGADTIAVTGFTLKSDNSYKIQGNGWDRFSVGGTLAVGPGQRAGTYSGLWFVTVVYE